MSERTDVTLRVLIAPDGTITMSDAPATDDSVVACLSLQGPACSDAQRTVVGVVLQMLAGIGTARLGASTLPAFAPDAVLSVQLLMPVGDQQQNVPFFALFQGAGDGILQVDRLASDGNRARSQLPLRYCVIHARSGRSGIQDLARCEAETGELSPRAFCVIGSGDAAFAREIAELANESGDASLCQAALACCDDAALIAHLVHTGKDPSIRIAAALLCKDTQCLALRLQACKTSTEEREAPVLARLLIDLNAQEEIIHILTVVPNYWEDSLFNGADWKKRKDAFLENLITALTPAQWIEVILYTHNDAIYKLCWLRILDHPELVDTHIVHGTHTNERARREGQALLVHLEHGGTHEKIANSTSGHVGDPNPISMPDVQCARKHMTRPR